MTWKLALVTVLYILVLACASSTQPTPQPTPNYTGYMQTAEALQTAYAQAQTEAAR